jgi:hypothetical protein
VARTADRSITLVLEPDDDVDTLTRLRRLHARPLGQIVCEPAPDGGSAALAYGLLAALGKTIDFEPPRDPLWHLIDLHLRAERVRHVVVLRAHTLTYPALRRVADHTHTAGAQLWLVVHQERAPTPVAHLLESVPHETAPLPALLALTPELGDDHSGLDVPLGRGLEFPYLAPIHELYEPLPRRRVRTTLTRGLPRAERAAVYDTWEQAHDWTLQWIDDRDELIDQDAADAVLALARAGDTASEIYVRIRAALDAFQQAGVKTNLRAVDAVFEHSYGETRPCELNTAAAHAAGLADQTPDPELAALIAVAVLARSPYYLRHANLRGLASDGAILVGPYGGVLAVPPELRRFLATWQHERQRHADGRALPLFLGNSHGRISQPAVRRRLARLDAPASLWEDSPDVGIGEGPSADGRSLLLHLSAWHLWRELEHDAAHG